MRRALLAVLLLLVVLAALLPAAAEHEPSHRYFVSGRVTLEEGGPACGVTIQAAKLGSADIRSGATDASGRYRIQLHLHSPEVAGETSDEGATLQVRVVGTNLVQTTTAVSGPATDGWGERQVDFRVPSSVAGECISPLALAGLYVGVPAGVLAGLSLAYVKVLRPWWVRRSIAPTLTSLTGIGRARQEELKALGIESLEDLAAAQPSQIANGTSIGKKEARRLIRRAREALQEPEGR